ncbi:MAG TPA: outer membrane beta-barrel protein [Bacteroidia bacterium]|nr:outer membrane beta-barrel protein [Bacteroidia bacterium]
MESGINFNVGPYAGILTSAKTDDNNLKDNFKSTDFGLGAGIGYQTGGGLGLAVNYCFGLANIGEDVSILGQNYTPEVKNTCIKLSLSFTLGGRRGG